MNRKDVYAIIDSERDYQDSKWGHTLSSDRAGKGERTIDEFILYIAGYTNDAVQAGSHYGSSEMKLEIIRKIAGLCVSCMEQHGAKPRKEQSLFA